MKGKILLILSLLFINYSNSQNLLTNPGFELGGSGVGFVCNGTGYTQLGTPYTGTTVPGNFAVVNNPNTLNTANFIFEGDHTTGSGRMLVIDGNTNATSPRFWKAGGTGAGVTTAVVGTTYHFSYWIKSTSNLGSPADIGIQITGGLPPVLVSGSTTAPAPSQSWRQVVYSFQATATTVQIELWNNNTAATGNDFAVDDFMLTDDLIVSANVTNAVCTTAADGGITVSAFGGTPPYINYSISGPVTQNNVTGVFSNLPPGTYTVTVTDSALPTAATATLNNVFVGPKITVPVNGQICAGSSFQLNAAGSPSGYTWTSNPAGFNSTIANPVVTPTVNTVYTVTSTVGACAPISASVSVTVNPLPTLTSGNLTQTICPGNQATFTVTGTPNTTVTVENTSVIPYTTTFNIGPTGTGIFTTPVLGASAVFSMTRIRNFFTLCESVITPAVTMTVNVVPNGCATVKTDAAPNTPPLDLTLCTTGECRTLQANFSPVPSTTGYAVSNIPYCPQAGFVQNAAPWIQLYGPGILNNQGGPMGDDDWSPNFTFPGASGNIPGFQFCFFGNTYNTLNVGTNCVIKFGGAGAGCPWAYTQSVPSAAFPILNSILGVYQDTDFSVTPTSYPAPAKSATYAVVGTYPCRKFIVNFANLPQFSGACNDNQTIGLQTSQIVLYEISNIIEVYVQRRVPCPSWNGGNGVIGIINSTGGQGYTPPGRNTGSWTSDPNGEAWRFTPTGTNVPVTIDWFEGPTVTGPHLGTGPTIQVCPTATTTYTLQATYQVCGVGQTATTNTTLNVYPDLTGTPNNITECVNSFDLTQNNSAILGSLNPTDYEITYHTSLADAQQGVHPIPAANLTTYSPGATVGTYVVYASIFLNSYNCHVVKPFNLIYDNCSIQVGPLHDLTVCDDSSNNGTAPFDLTQLDSAALGSHSAADYTISYHLTLPNATTPAISPANNYTGTNGQIIYVRIIDNTDPTIFATSSFVLHINTFANAGTDGNTTVCETSTTPINLFSLITGEQTGGTWTRTGGTGGTFSATAGTYTPAVGATTSTFEYTITGVTPCSNDVSIATVNINTQPTAGTDGGTVICATNTAPINLFSLITGEQTGGTWTRSGGTGGTFNAAAGTFIPTAGANTSTFDYTVSGAIPCGTDVSVATVTINPQPNAGTDGSTTVCETSTAVINLFSLITGEQAGGTWTRTGTGGVFDATNGTFTPAVGATTSTFTYTITGTAPCISDSSDAVVTIIAQPNAGTDGSTTVCETSTTAIDLFGLITGEQTGGVWTRTGTGTGGTFNAATGTFTPAVGATTSTFVYTVTGTTPCGTDTSQVIVTINPQPTAGTDGGTTICETSTTVINLFSLITGEQAGGVWTRTGSGTGGTFNATAGTFTPAVGATTSTFEYTVSGTAPCINDVSVATVTINPQPNAGTDGNTTVCETSTAPVDLFSLITGEQAGGVWTRTGTGTGGTFDPVLGTFTPAVGATNSTFIYTLTGTAPCINDTSQATVNINRQPTAGTDGNTTICENSTTIVNLNTLITGEQTGGVWTRATGTGGTFNATAGTFVSALGATTSTFQYTVSGTAPCINDVSVATVTINPVPTATITGTASVCMGATAPSVVFTGANGTSTYNFGYTLNIAPFTASTTGTNSSVSVPIPSTASAATFTYNLTSVRDVATGCNQGQSGTATVTVIAAPIINTPSNYVVCDDSLNNDGLYCAFDMTTKNREITTDPAVQLTYYETQTDADTGGTTNAIVSPYCNNRNYDQTIYVRAFNPAAPACYSTTSFHLIINSIPIPNPNIPDYKLCDYTAPADKEVFNLGTKIPEITSSSTVTVTFYPTLSAAQNQTGPALPLLYQNTTNPQQIWFNIKDNVTGCNTTGSFNLIVNPLPQAVQPGPLFACSNGVVLTGQFDLTSNENTVRNGIPGSTVTYYHSLADAQNGVPATAITPADSYHGTDNETIYIRVENNITHCYATTTQLLRVTQGPLAVTPRPMQYCDPDNNGIGEFDLTSVIQEIEGGTLDPNVRVTFHETSVDAVRGSSPIPLNVLYNNIQAWSQILYVRVYYITTGCANYVELKLNVNRTPEANTPSDYAICDMTGLDHYETFDLTTRIPEILGSINPTLTNVYFYEQQSDALVNNTANAIVSVGGYTNTVPDQQTIYVVVQTRATGCFDVVELHLVVSPLPISQQPNYLPYSVCDNNRNRIGYEVFNLADQIASIQAQNGQTGMNITFHLTQADAVRGTPSLPLSYENVRQFVQTIWVRITNPATTCYSISTMDLRVEPLPTLVPQASPYTICDDNPDGISCGFDLSTLIPTLLQGANYTLSFYETIVDAQQGNVINVIDHTQPYCNSIPFVQQLYVRAVDNITGCVSVTQIELNVDPSPVSPVQLSDIVVCDYDSNTQDQQTLVDLTQKNAAILAQQPLAASNYAITYHGSSSDAQQGTGQLIPFASHLGHTNDTIWVRVENIHTHCYSIGSFHLIINAPLLLTTPAALSLCDDDASPNDQHHAFDLTIKNSEITQNLTGYTVTYYPSLADAQNHRNAISAANATAYVNVPPAVQTLGVVVTSPAPASCQSITTLDIRVLPIPTPRTNPSALPPQCDYNNPGDMLEYFDLTTNEGYIANGDRNLRFHYFRTQAEAEAGNLANEITPANRALVGQDVWIRVENTLVDYQGNHCYVVIRQALKVNPLPTVAQNLDPFRACDNDADGFTVFNLADPTLAPRILGTTQSTADYAVTYYQTAAGADPTTNTGELALPSSYTNTTAFNQTIYIRVTNNTTGCSNATGQLNLVVEDYATATSPATFRQCDNGVNNTSTSDGRDEIDLNQFNAAVLNGQNPAVFLVSYYIVDPTTNPNAVALSSNEAQHFMAGPTTRVWAKVENSSNTIRPLCSAVAPVDIVIEPRPNADIKTANGVTTICVRYTDDQVLRTLTLDTGITNPGNYIFEWFQDGSTTAIAGATGPTYTVDTPSAGAAPRTYIVHITNNFAGTLGCDSYSRAFTVVQSGPAVVAAGAQPGYVISNAFSDPQSITVNVVGYGDYWYSLDDGPRQQSNVFDNVSFDPHIIHVWDMTDGVANSCDEFTIQFATPIDYPHYFTPNGDGINDTWFIRGLKDMQGVRLYIFDRYGKLLKQLSASGPGWDGTYNGHMLPADDYWFTVEFTEPNTSAQTLFKAHFTLKR